MSGMALIYDTVCEIWLKKARDVRGAKQTNEAGRSQVWESSGKVRRARRAKKGK
jgi:hypothetical protein